MVKKVLAVLSRQAVVKRYKSTYNFNQNIKSTMTPCGTFLFSSGADTKIYCWNIDTGDQVAPTNLSVDYLKPARDLDFHPFDNMMAVCSFEHHSPIYVLNYNSDSNFWKIKIFFIKNNFDFF